MRYIKKIILSTLLLLISTACFYLPNEYFAYEGIPKMFEWIGLFFLIFVVWPWREDLGIKSLGGIEERLAPQSEESIARKSKGEPDDEVQALRKQYDKDRHEEAKSKILAYANKHGVIYSLNQLQVELGLSRPTLNLILYSLVKDNKLRKDEFKGGTRYRSRIVYTPEDSYTNIAIDKLKSELGKYTKVLDDKRYLRIDHRYEIDAIIMCEDMEAHVEVRNISNVPTDYSLDKWVSKLVSINYSLSVKRTEHYILLVCNQDDIVKKTKLVVDEKRLPDDVRVIVMNVNR